MFTWRLPCPHCNGPNDVAMDRHCLTCRYCGAGLWVRCPDAYPTVAPTARIDRREAIFRWDHYLKQQRRPLSPPGREAHLLHLPFWHINAIVAIHHPIPAARSNSEMLFCADSTGGGELWSGPAHESEHRDSNDAPWDIKPWDLSFSAFDQGLCGLESLGVRTQTISLGGCPDSPSPDAAHWCPPNGQPGDAIPRLSEAVRALTVQESCPGAVAPRIIAPQVSLIYWPVWILAGHGADSRSCVEIDAVSGRVIRETPNPPQLPESAGAVEGEAPRLLPHRCPSCGADLPVDGALGAFPCSNCGVLVAHAVSGDRRTLTCEFAGTASQLDSAWYPFWLFEPGQIMVPAFPIRNLRALVRFGMLVSGQNRLFSVTDNPPTGLFGVSVMPEVAAGMAELIRDQKSKSPQSILSAAPRLVFIPLRTENTELNDPVTGLCLPQAVLAHLES